MCSCSVLLLPDAPSGHQWVLQWAGQDTSGAPAVLSACLHRSDHTAVQGLRLMSLGFKWQKRNEKLNKQHVKLTGAPWCEVLALLSLSLAFLDDGHLHFAPVASCSHCSLFQGAMVPLLVVLWPGCFSCPLAGVGAPTLGSKNQHESGGGAGKAIIWKEQRKGGKRQPFSRAGSV